MAPIYAGDEDEEVMRGRAEGTGRSTELERYMEASVSTSTAFTKKFPGYRVVCVPRGQVSQA